MCAELAAILLLARCRRQISSQPSTSPILLVGNVLHPLNHFAVQRLLNGDMRHHGRRRRAVPMFFARRKPNYVACTNLFNFTALALRPPGTCGDDQRLTEGMRMPGGARTWLECHACAAHARRFRSFK